MITLVLAIAWVPVPAGGAIIDASPSYLDETFGSGGTVLVDVDADAVFSTVLALPTGGAVLVGTSASRLVLVEVDRRGVVTWSSDLGLANVFEVFGAALDQSGRLIIGVRNSVDPMVLRIAGRQLDPTWGTGGVAQLSLDGASSIAVRQGGGVLVGGFQVPPGSQALDGTGVVLALTSAGVVDASFGQGGRYWGPNQHDPNVGGMAAMAVDDAGRIVAVTREAGFYEAAMIRLLGTGQPDPAFSGDGIARIGGRASDVELLLDGRIAVLQGGAFAVVERYLADGSRDLGYDGDGASTLAWGDEPTDSLELDGSGRMVSTGGPAIRRHLADGIPDPWFRSFEDARYHGVIRPSLGGNWYAKLTSIAVGPQDRLLVGGVATDAQTQQKRFVLWRIEPMSATSRTATGWVASRWEALDGAGRGGAAVVGVAAGTSEVFVRGTDDRLWYRRVGAERGPWRSIPSSLTAPPAVVRSADGRRLVAVRGGDGAIWLGEVVGDAFSGWMSLGGGSQGAPGIGVTSGGDVVVAIRGLDDRLWYRRRASGTWGPWTAVASILRDAPALRSSVQGGLDVLVRGNDDALWTLGVEPASPWQRTPSILTAAPAGSHDGTAVVTVVRGGDGRLWLRQRNAWEPIDGEVAGAPGIARLPGAGETAMDLVVTRNDGSVWLRRLTPPGP